MKVLVLGCGNIGTVAAEDLARSMSEAKITVADYDGTRARTAAEKIQRNNATWTQLDVTERNKLGGAMKEFDLVMGFLPGNLGYKLAETCAESGKNLVDVSYMAENPLELHEKAIKTGATIIPDCGLAPGISNILVGHAASKLDKVESVRMMVGGLPEKPIPPLGYIITWSPESLIDEYTRKARIMKNGREAEVAALSGVEEVEFPEIGKLEAFYTDGLRTLLNTMGRVDEMWEKTLRYPGHAEKMKLLETLGFFEEEVNIGGLSISPRKITAKLLRRKLWKPEVKDIVALKVQVTGIKEGKQKRFVYHMLDKFDSKHGITAMARTTAYPASIAAQLLLKGTVKEKGIVPPEKIGMHDELFDVFVNELEKRYIKITKEETNN